LIGLNRTFWLGVDTYLADRSNVNGKLDYVNTSTQQVYNDALKAGLFDYMFVQAYNTGGNYVDQQGIMYSWYI